MGKAYVDEEDSFFLSTITKNEKIFCQEAASLKQELFIEGDEEQQESSTKNFRTCILKNKNIVDMIIQSEKNHKSLIDELWINLFCYSYVYLDI